MAKEIVVTTIGNRIEYATTNGKGLITGKREDITERAIIAVFDHLKEECNRENKDGKAYGRTFGEHGSLMFIRPGTTIVWEENNEEVE